MLEAKRIHKEYYIGGKTIEVLKGIDFRIEQGSFTAVIGPSGAGKSTLLHILGGLDAPTQGDVTFRGENIYQLKDLQLCRMRNKSIGFVFQAYHLLPEFTVLENVLMPFMIAREQNGAEEKKKYALDLLSQAGLAGRLEHFPSQLSGGEQQRVAIIRALMNNPQVLLCDEPTGNLDSQTGGEILALITRLHRQQRMAVVLVTHNMELAKSAEKIYHLKDGKWAS